MWMEIGQEIMAWLRHLLMNWIGFISGEENLSYMNIILLLLLLLLLWSNSGGTFVMCLVYGTSIVAYIYKRINNVPEGIHNHSWHKLRHFLAYCFIKYGTIMYGHEVIGMEHLPEGPGIIILYHGTVDIDHLLLISNIYMRRGKLPISVTDKALFSLPGLKPAFDMTGTICGDRADCVEVLKKGYLLLISPGGSREALFSDHYYQLLWGKRTGFAQVALEAKVPIIPMFTQNIQEAYRGFGRTRLLRWLYEKTRRTAIPIYGGFPVKLRTYLGEPIPYDPNITAVELAEKAKIAVEKLRDRHQKIPGNILRALCERFDRYHKND